MIETLVKIEKKKITIIRIAKPKKINKDKNRYLNFSAFCFLDSKNGSKFFVFSISTSALDSRSNMTVVKDNHSSSSILLKINSTSPKRIKSLLCNTYSFIGISLTKVLLVL